MNRQTFLSTMAGPLRFTSKHHFLSQTLRHLTNAEPHTSAAFVLRTPQSHTDANQFSRACILLFPRVKGGGN